jgi:hypothetical protein
MGDFSLFAIFSVFVQNRRVFAKKAKNAVFAKNCDFCEKSRDNFIDSRRISCRFSGFYRKGRFPYIYPLLAIIAYFWLKMALFDHFPKSGAGQRGVWPLCFRK